jgi:hypothetical protein
MITKTAAELKIGDSICYRSGDLEDPSQFSKLTIPLSGTILKIVKLDYGRLKITTVSGTLKSCSQNRVFELEKQSDKSIQQRQYDCNLAETFMGVSIE